MYSVEVNFVLSDYCTKKCEILDVGNEEDDIAEGSSKEVIFPQK